MDFIEANTPSNEHHKMLSPSTVYIQTLVRDETHRRHMQINRYKNAWSSFAIWTTKQNPNAYIYFDYSSATAQTTLWVLRILIIQRKTCQARIFAARRIIQCSTQMRVCVAFYKLNINIYVYVCLWVFVYMHIIAIKNWKWWLVNAENDQMTARFDLLGTPNQISRVLVNCVRLQMQSKRGICPCDIFLTG